MNRMLSIIPLAAEGSIVVVLFLVGTNYVSLRRRQLAGEALEKFNRKTEHVTLAVMILFLISFLAIASTIRWKG